VKDRFRKNAFDLIVQEIEVMKTEEQNVITRNMSANWLRMGFELMPAPILVMFCL